MILTFSVVLKIAVIIAMEEEFVTIITVYACLIMIPHHFV
jgi:hypothetical protein